MYEIISILKPDLSTDAIESRITSWKGTISSLGGELDHLIRIGKKTLAYEVRKNRQGYMILMHIHGPHAVKDELERQFKISEDVIKFQTVKLNDLQLKVSRATIAKWEPGTDSAVDSQEEVRAESSDQSDTEAVQPVEEETSETPSASADTESQDTEQVSTETAASADTEA